MTMLAMMPGGSGIRGEADIHDAKCVVLPLKGASAIDKGGSDAGHPPVL